MPIYTYRCQDCSIVYEERRRFEQAEEPSNCPTCEGIRVQRLITAPVLLRGSNWLSLGSGGCACSNGGSCACRAASTKA